MGMFILLPSVLAIFESSSANEQKNGGCSLTSDKKKVVVHKIRKAVVVHQPVIKKKVVVHMSRKMVGVSMTNKKPGVQMQILIQVPMKPKKVALTTKNAIALMAGIVEIPIARKNKLII